MHAFGGSQSRTTALIIDSSPGVARTDHAPQLTQDVFEVTQSRLWAQRL